MKTKKFTAALLIILLLITLLSACSNDNTADNMPTSGSGEKTQGESIENNAETLYYTPELPDVTYGGYDFRFLNTENEAVTWLLTQLEAEAESGDVLNDAIYRRNRIIEEQYNIKLTETLVNGTDELLSRARRSIQGGSDDWDMIMLTGANAFTAAQSGLLTEVKNIPNIDLTKGYWDNNVEKSFSLQNNLYMLGGDFSFTHYSATMVMFFNKKLAADYALEDPYALVRDGKWTFDKFHSLARQTIEDLNGDGIMDKDDRYGYLSLTFLLYPAFMTAANESYIKKDDTDTPYLNIGSEKFVQVYAKMLGIMHDGYLLFDANVADDHRLQNIMFPNNQTLFWTELMNWSKILRDMEADFGILPHPKYDETQEEYRSMVAGTTLMTVPTTNTDFDRTGVILEALCAQSRKSVMPVYYDTVLKTKISRDDESGEMLDVIFANRVYDLADVAWNSQCYEPFNNLARGNNADVASFLDRNKDRIDAAIERTLNAFNDNN